MQKLKHNQLLDRRLDKWNFSFESVHAPSCLRQTSTNLSSRITTKVASDIKTSVRCMQWIKYVQKSVLGRGFLNLSNVSVHVPRSVNKLIQESTRVASEINQAFVVSNEFRNFLEIDLWFRKFGIMSNGSVHLPVHAPSCGSPRVSCGLHIGISTSQGVHGFKALYGLFDPTNTILPLESRFNKRTDTCNPAISEINVNDVWNSTQDDIGSEADECCAESTSSVGPYRAKWLRSRGRGKWRRGRKTSGTSRGEYQ